MFVITEHHHGISVHVSSALAHAPRRPRAGAATLWVPELPVIYIKAGGIVSLQETHV